ncbi:MAG TPA: reverse transcriptase family protein, partial [Candidatus Ozemobacteraceae bacterium]|nr:reverse transcriptase family protein [Candidatus Ozemobacteraceae bacterium]
TEADVAEALGISVGQLRHFSIHRERERVCHYVRFAIPKRTGGERVIMAPKKRMKGLLRQLNRDLVQKLPVHEAARGFVPGGSVRANAEPHVGRKYVIRLDIRDFFPTLHFGRVRGYLIAVGFGYAVATILAVLMTEAERQPVQIDNQVYQVPIGSRYCVQGAPTSPGLANAIFKRADRRLSQLAAKLEMNYSRYADDLTFSGDDESVVVELFRYAMLILTNEGFTLNLAKTRVMRASNAQRVTGATVNQVLGLSKKERKRLRAALHQNALAPDKSREPRTTLLGRLAWVQALNPTQAEVLRRDYERHHRSRPL